MRDVDIEKALASKKISLVTCTIVFSLLIINKYHSMNSIKSFFSLLIINKYYTMNFINLFFSLLIIDKHYTMNSITPFVAMNLLLLFSLCITNYHINSHKTQIPKGFNGLAGNKI